MFIGGSVDYTDTVGGITLSLAQTRACINIPIMEDLLLEDDESFGVTLTTTSNIASVQVIPSATAIIIDDPPSGMLPVCKLEIISCCYISSLIYMQGQLLDSSY